MKDLSHFECAVRKLRGMVLEKIAITAAAHDIQCNLGIDEYKLIAEAHKPGSYIRTDGSMVIYDTDLPAPDTLIRNQHGDICALMFHYAADEQSLEDIAYEQGFEVKVLSMMDDDLPEDDPLVQRYAAGEGGVEKDWTPKAPGGWALGIKFDTEDGPVALFIRPKAEAVRDVG